ncbi:hypothetical protein KUTeg_011234 [Tegillarca granosa]|uniref:Uncharacterized protein n=1 Tax=Tegillarca granosa TaxID=220873 RepID=A0ABQ9F3R4_TEGGR|nr:hypothetical protein KUTeg_011234 [Tegillarca granosa]
MISQPTAPRGVNNLPSIFPPYEKACFDSNNRAVGLSSFKDKWLECCPHIRISTPRDDTERTLYAACIRQSLDELHGVVRPSGIKDPVWSHIRWYTNAIQLSVRRESDSPGSHVYWYCVSDPDPILHPFVSTFALLVAVVSISSRLHKTATALLSCGLHVKVNDSPATANSDEPGAALSVDMLDPMSTERYLTVKKD